VKFKLPLIVMVSPEKGCMEFTLIILIVVF
jgi:hypothetical protein